MASSKSRPAAADPVQGNEMYTVGPDDGMHGAEGLTVLGTAPPSTATEDATQDDGDSTTPSTGWWRFTGAYACAYTTPDRVSQWIQPGQIVSWPDGPPDTNWEAAPIPEPEPAPVVSDQNTEE
jgi:hypothetical protein